MVTLHDAIETIKNGVFVFFFEKNKKIGWKKQVGCFFDKNGFCSTLIVFWSFLWFSLDRTIWNKSRHYQFDWVCATHLECGCLVMKKLRITATEYVKISVDNKTSFEKLNPCSMY